MRDALGRRVHLRITCLVPAAIVTSVAGCASRSPSFSAGQSTLTSACPCMSARDGGAASYGPDGAGPMMGGMMTGGTMMGYAAAPGAAVPLSPEAKAALFRALDEEYRAEAQYAHPSSRFGSPPPLGLVTHAQHRHAWVLETLVLAHGLENPANRWPGARQPEVAGLAAACRAGVDSEKKTIALYDDLLKVDVPADLRRAFASLRAVSAELHLPAFEACR